jgi:hypothetical protein
MAIKVFYFCLNNFKFAIMHLSCFYFCKITDNPSRKEMKPLFLFDGGIHAVSLFEFIYILAHVEISDEFKLRYT